MATASPYTHGRSEIWQRGPLVTVIKRERRRLAGRLRALRHKRKLTQVEAAECVGLHPVHLNRIECGAVNVTFPTLVALAVAYRVSLGALFSDE